MATRKSSKPPTAEGGPLPTDRKPPVDAIDRLDALSDKQVAAESKINTALAELEVLGKLVEGSPSATWATR